MSKSPRTFAILITAAIVTGCGSKPSPAPADHPMTTAAPATFPSTLPVTTGEPPMITTGGLRFAPPSIDAILAGTKTGTTRFWKNRSLGTGHLDVSDGARTIGITVTSVTHKKFDALTNDDARAEGLDTLEALRQKLMKDYPAITDGDVVTVIRFTLPPAH